MLLFVCHCVVCDCLYLYFIPIVVGVVLHQFLHLYQHLTVLSYTYVNQLDQSTVCLFTRCAVNVCIAFCFLITNLNFIYFVD